MHRFGKVIAVDIRDELAAQRAVAVKLERFVGHDRAEIGSTDTDIDHVADLLAGVTEPLARADAVGERRHFVEHLVHSGNNILAVDEDFLRARRAQSRVQHRTVLGAVDFFSAEHGVNASAQSPLFGQGEKQTQRLARDAVFRVIEKKTASFGGERGSPLRFRGEKLAQMQAGHLGMMFLQGVPGGSVGQRFHAHKRAMREPETASLLNPKFQPRGPSIAPPAMVV